MKTRLLGRSNISVSRLCFGSLTVSPSQADLSPLAGGELIAYALDHGVNFIDTAQMYQTYPHIKAALTNISSKPVISSKTYAWNWGDAWAAVDEARRELDLDYIDIFLLHEQESVMTMHGHAEALKGLLDLRDKGVIGAVGISTHAIEPVRAMTQAISNNLSDLWQEFDPGPWREADIIHPLLNKSGIGLLDGSAFDMRVAVKEAADAGLGIYGMKMFGGGHLLSDFGQAVAYSLSQNWIASYAVGMQSFQEVDANIKLFERYEDYEREQQNENRDVSDGDFSGVFEEETEIIVDLNRFSTGQDNRHLIVSDWCTGCGSCLERCKSDALSINPLTNKVVVDHSRCTLCSYCASACRDFVLKII